MDVNKNSYTFTFAAIMVILVATLLSNPFDLEIVQCIDNFVAVLNRK